MNGDTVETETQVYNAANELTSQVVKGVTVSYAYDQFGRLTQKSKTGSRVANFYYNYGDKLTKVSSKLPGNGEMNQSELRINIGCGPATGDQKRRSRSVSGGAMTKYRVDQGFVSPLGTPLEARALAPGTTTKRRVYTVLKPITALSGTAAPWFDQPGGGTQFKLSHKIEDLIRLEFIRR